MPGAPRDSPCRAQSPSPLLSVCPSPCEPPYQHPLFRAVTGRAWRPGGVELTAHALDFLSAGEGPALAPCARVLDIGCGAGGTLELLLQRGLRAVGLDRDIPSEVASRGVPLLHGDACCLPLAGGVFDAVISECVLSLLPQPEAALRQWARVLRRGGTLLLADIYARRAPREGATGELGATGAAETARPVPSAPGGCLAGAVPQDVVATRLRNAGFVLRRWEDHSRALRALAAQLVWNGAGGEDLARWLGLGEASHCSGGASFCRSGARYGYGLWIADKE